MLMRKFSAFAASAYVCRRRCFKQSLFEPQALCSQKRWLHRNHIRRIVAADTEWRDRADAILAGKKQSMLRLLEERGYVNQIVGCDPLTSNFEDGRLILQQ